MPESRPFSDAGAGRRDEPAENGWKRVHSFLSGPHQQPGISSLSWRHLLSRSMMPVSVSICLVRADRKSDPRATSQHIDFQ